MAAAVAGALALSTPARADIVDAFETVCLKTDARTELARQEAFRIGWKLAPPMPRKEPLKPGETEIDLLNPASGKDEMIRASTFIPKVPQGFDAVFALCAAFSGERVGDLQKSLAGRLGKPFVNQEGFHVWMYSRRDGAMVREDGLFNSNEATLKAAFQDRSIYTVALIPEESGNGSIIMSAIRRPDDAPAR